MLLAEIFPSKNAIKVLYHLYRFNRQFSISEISRDVGIAKSNAQIILTDMGEKGIVTEESRRKIRLFKLNKSNFLVKTIILPTLSNYSLMKSNILKKIIRKLEPKKHKEIISVIAYGSVISERFTFRSDVDIMVIVSKKTKSMNDLFNYVKNELLNEELIVMFDIISIKEFKKLYGKREPLILSITKESKCLYGKDPLELV